MSTLSIVIPAYNEERFIGTLLERVKAIDLSSLGIEAQIIVIDDASIDNTAEIARRTPDVTLIRLARHRGKGMAVRAGIAAATGEYLIIQDADLEYCPGDYLLMLQPLLSGQADIVYGSRYLKGRRYPKQSLAAYVGGRSLSLVALAFSGRHLTDPATALKLFHRPQIAALDLETTGFEIDHEITARLAHLGARFVEVPIRYSPRTRREGKKIGVRDWFLAIATFARYRNG